MSMRTYDTAYASAAGDHQSSAGQEDSVSVFDRYSSFDGTFNLTRDLRVEGQVKGTITCKGTLFVAEGATVDASIEAEHISVAGDLTGEVNCHGRLKVLSSGKVKGKIVTSSLIIDEGAVYEGELVMETGQGEPGSPQALRSRGIPAAVTSSNSTPAEPGSIQQAAGGSTFIRRFGGQETAWETTGAEDNGDSSP